MTNYLKVETKPKTSKKPNELTELIIPTHSFGNTLGHSNDSQNIIMLTPTKLDNKRSSLIRMLKPSMDEEATKFEIGCYYFIKYFFLVGLFICIIIGILFSEFASDYGPLYPKITASWISVIIIFFITGLAVKTKELKKASMFWGLNTFVHVFIYIYFPLISLGVSKVLKNVNINDHKFNRSILNGLIITCCLPTTIGTAVVFTQNARGNEAAAIINTTLANLLGIIVSPGLIYLFVGEFGDNVNFGDIAISLCLRVIVPFMLGQIIRFCLGHNLRLWLKPKKAFFKKITEICLLFIVLCAISETFYEGLNAEFFEIIIIIIVIVLLHSISIPVVWFLSGLCNKRSNNIKNTSMDTGDHISEANSQATIKHDSKCTCNQCFAFNVYDRIAITFCATQKTVGFGIPMIETLYDGKHELIGLFIVPLLVFEIVQLIIDSMLINYFGKKAKLYAQQVYNDLLKSGIKGKKLENAKRTMEFKLSAKKSSIHGIVDTFYDDDIDRTLQNDILNDTK